MIPDRRAFTLVEAVVASLLVVLLAMGASEGWKLLADGIRSNRSRARLVHELRIVTMSIAGDLPSANGITMQPEKLVLQEEGGDWVRYERDEGRLLRTPKGGDSIVVATGISAFEPVPGSTYPVRVRITAAVMGSERRLDLELAP